MNSIKTILITRPLDQAKSLAKKLTQLNFKPIIFPAIEIHAINFDANINLNKFNMIIFVSPAAVIRFSSHIKTLPNHLKIFTIGEDSAALIKELGWTAPIHPYPHFSREALLNLPEMQNVSQIPILIVEGKNGNNELATSLKLRGATVSQLLVYERMLPQPKQLPNLDTVDIVIATSEQSLNNLVLLLGPTIKDKILLVSSQKLVDLAASLGFTEKPLLAQNAGDNAIIQALPISA